MRMRSEARFLLQMLAVSFMWASGPAMSQTQLAAPAKATPAKTETCSFIPSSADGKEQICVKAGAKAGATPKAKGPVLAPTTASATARKLAAGPSGASAKPAIASGVVKTPASGLALKSSTALKAPPIAKANELASSKTGTAVAAPVAAAAPVAPATAVPEAAQPPLSSAGAAAPVLAPQALPTAEVAPMVAPAAAAVTATVVATPRATPGARKLRSDEAARRYSDGLELERKGEPQAAMLAYLDAAESGNGLAQKRLGDIYGTGTAYAERDYGLALKWYERARAQGVEIPKPFTYSGLRQ